MTGALALAAIVLAAGWLAFVAGVCALQPKRARRGLAAMGSNWPIQIGEHVLRSLAGLALVARAEWSKFPDVFAIGGWFVVGTSVLILLLPRRWHHAYARWWADRIPLPAYRWLALPTLALASLLLWAAL